MPCVSILTKDQILIDMNETFELRRYSQMINSLVKNTLRGNYLKINLNSKTFDKVILWARNKSDLSAFGTETLNELLDAAEYLIIRNLRSSIIKRIIELLHKDILRP
jgi:hypothetical protein